MDAAISESMFNMMEGCIPEYVYRGHDRPPSGSTISGTCLIYLGLQLLGGHFHFVIVSVHSTFMLPMWDQDNCMLGLAAARPVCIRIPATSGNNNTCNWQTHAFVEDNSSPCYHHTLPVSCKFCLVYPCVLQAWQQSLTESWS